MTKPSIEPLKIAIKAIQEQDKKERKWEKTFNEMLDGRFICCPSETLHSALLKVLEIMYRDEEEQIISWWIYETDCGKKKDFHIYDGGGVVPTDTIEDLYNYLIKYHFKDEELDFYDKMYDCISKCNTGTTYIEVEDKPVEKPFTITCNK